MKKFLLTSSVDSTLRIFFLITILILIGETFDIFFLEPYSTSDVIVTILIKTVILSACIIPMLYYFVFRPVQYLNSERHLMNERLKESERRFRTLADASPALIWMADTEKKCTYFNSTWLKYTGRTMEQEYGDGWAEGVHPEDLKRCFDTYTSSFDARRPFVMEYRLHRADGSYGWLIDQGKPNYTPEGEFIGYIGSCTDISDRKEAEESLRTAKDRLESTVFGTQAGTWEWNIQTGETVFNDRWAEILGYSLKELAPTDITTWKNFTHPADLERSTEALQRHFSGEQSYYDIECRMKHKSGQWIWVHDRGCIVSRTADGKPLMMYGTHTDITARKQSEQALLEQNARIRAMFETHSAVMLLVEPVSGKILDANTAAARFYGYTTEQMCSMNIDSINVLVKDEIAVYRKKAAENDQNNFIFPHRLADGTIRTVEVYSTLVEYGKDKVLFSIIHDVTERRLTEVRLEQSEETFRNFVHQSGDGISIIGENGTVIEWNSTLEKITGFPASRAIGMTFREIQGILAPLPVNDQMLELQHQVITKALKTGEAPFFNTVVESQYKTSSGEVRSVQQMVFPIKTENGFRLGMISRDMTEQKKIDELVKQTRENYDSFFNTIDDLLFVLDVSGNIIFTNRTVNERLGYTPEELLGASVLSVHPEERREEAARIVAEMLKGTAEFCPVPLKTKNGVLIPVETRVKLGSWNNAPVIFGVTKDISRIQLSEEKFSKIFYLNPSACGLSDLSNGAYIEVNDAFCRLLGFDQDEVIGKTAVTLGIATEEMLRSVRAHIEPSGRVINAPAELRAKNGEVKHVLLSAENIIVQEKHYRFTMVNDITEQRRAQEQIESLAARHQTILHTASDGIHVLDENGDVVEANYAFAEMLGYTREEVLKMNVKDWDVHWSGPELKEKVPELITQPTVFETRHKRKDGTIREIEINSTGVMMEGKRYLYASARDITERKISEESLRHQQKLESIGTLAGGIAHDFNNLLVAILGQSSIALNKVPKGSSVESNITKVIKASERAADLTRQLLAYSGKGKFFISEMDVNALIHENVQMFELSVPRTCTIEYRLEPNLPHIKGDVGQIQQVIMNLIINAGEAIGLEPGTIVIESNIKDFHEVPSDYWRYTNSPLTPGVYTSVSITDTGSGIRKELLPKIFDPFFSTKFTGRGLGLAAVLGIIRGHNGGLAIVSEETVGTTFEVLFPSVVHASSVVSGIVNLGTVSDGAGRTILVIDDEPSVTELLEDLLSDLHYTVLTAHDPAEGIEIYRKHSTDIVLVVLDFSMPGMNGRTAFQKLCEINPGVTVMLCSGFSEEQTFSTFGERRPAGFFQKPYKPQLFLEKMSIILSDRQQSSSG